MVFVHKRVRTKPRKTKAYVNNKDFYQAILDYYTTKREAIAEGREVPEITRYIADCLSLICQKLSNKPNFYSYTYKDEMIGDAILNCCAALSRNSFNPEKSNNPFAYFTSIIWNSYIGRIKEENNEALAKALNFENQYLFAGETDPSFVLQMPTNDYIDDKLRNHENKKSARKFPVKKKAKPKAKKKKKKTNTLFKE